MSGVSLFEEEGRGVSVAYGAGAEPEESGVCMSEEDIEGVVVLGGRGLKVAWADGAMRARMDGIPGKDIVSCCCSQPLGFGLGLLSPLLLHL